MAYTRTDWVSGETPLSADNLNNIEDGIEELNSKSVSMVVLSKIASDPDISLSTSMKIVSCPNLMRVSDSNTFGQTSDGGVRIKASGTFLILAFVNVSSANASDDVRITCTRNRSGSIVDSYESAFSSGTFKTVTAMWINTYNADDLVYIRARNVTGARGSATQARFVVIKV